MRTLVALHYSPWSEKARWALDHHGIPYDYREHQIMLGEPWLRWKLRRATGRVSVPALFDEGAVYDDSWDIARRAASLSTGETLFPTDLQKDIALWNDRSEEALAEGRRRTTERIAESPAAKRAELPPFVPDALRGPLTPLADQGIALIRKKYFAGAPPPGAMRQHLLALRAALDEGGGFVLGRLTYADLAMGVALQFVSPVDERFIRLHADTRPCWTWPELAEEFEDLVRWRDGLYEAHRA